MPWGGGARARRILCFGGTDQERERRRQKKNKKWCEVRLNRKREKRLDKINTMEK